MNAETEESSSAHVVFPILICLFGSQPESLKSASLEARFQDVTNTSAIPTGLPESRL